MEEAEIIDIMLDGRGVAEHEGKKVFVPYTITGERVRFEALKKKKKFDEAKLLEVLVDSEYRVTPQCKYFGVCGGCATQHIAAEAQIEFKQQAVLDTLQRIGHVKPTEVFPPVVDEVWNYRRRARLAVKYVTKKSRALVGFREKYAPYLTDMLSCEVLHTNIARLISPLSQLITNLSIRTKIPQIECSVAENVTALVFRVLEPPSDSDLAALQAFENKYQVRVYLQTKGLDTVAALTNDADLEALYFHFESFGVKLEFLPVDFIQVHDGVNQKMVQLAFDWLQLSDDSKLLDLFCGLGNFTLPLAKHAQQVLGVEGDAKLVERARHNANLNDLANIEFIQADLFDAETEYSWLTQDWDTVIIDPPRLGARNIIEKLSGLQPAKILYVSCHPATLARDADILVNTMGYQLSRVCVLDMFPHTGHVETMALFEK